MVFRNMNFDVWPDGWGSLHRGVFLIIDGVGLMLTVAIFDIYQQPTYWNIQRSTVAELTATYIEYITSSMSLTAVTPESAFISLGVILVVIGLIRYLLLSVVRHVYKAVTSRIELRRDV